MISYICYRCNAQPNNNDKIVRLGGEYLCLDCANDKISTEGLKDSLNFARKKFADDFDLSKPQTREWFEEQAPVCPREWQRLNLNIFDCDKYTKEEVDAYNRSVKNDRNRR